ncbi:DUF3540 domain-containing protein [uncultured Desulfovibrio sp.]|uniref:DUF3540 domain-containing protein n=1 Tax=uncultured Desulfovibrio sp. TaxID=167968 RepID=UPI003208B3DC
MEAHALICENSLVTGTIQSRAGDILLVAGPFGLIRALRADGCLLRPEPRDTVLLALTENGEAWIISVLRRAAAQASAELALPEDTRLHGRSLTLEADALRLSGRTVDVRAGLLALGGRMLLQGFAVIQTLCRHMGERALRRRGRYAALDEEVRDLAHRAAGRVRSEARSSYRLRAEHADIRATEQVDIDGRHIKVG